MSDLPVPVAASGRPELVDLLGSLAPRQTDPFLAEVTVAAGHLSRLIPHCNNVELLRWIDRVAELHGDALGEARADLVAANRAWFVARHEVDYRTEAFEGDRLVIATSIRSARRSIRWRDSWIVRPADRAVICSAASLWVHLDLATRRPVPPPATASTRPGTA